MPETVVYATSGFGEMAGTAFVYGLHKQPAHVPGGAASLTLAPSKAQPAGATVEGSQMPMWLTAHPSGRFVYTVDMAGDGSVHSYRVERPGGALTPINRSPSGGAGPCHLTVTDKHVMVANCESLTTDASGCCWFFPDLSICRLPFFVPFAVARLA
eukprot:SAG22_NODE_2477_length_2530_cov_1.385027_2_plen_156_part_00